MFKRVLAKSRIESLNLTGVESKLREKYGWDTDRITVSVAEYRKFLHLISRYPGEVMVPWSEDMDEVWHNHMLDSRKYMDDCNRIFGRYIHHNPHLAVGTHEQKKHFENTKKRYREEVVKKNIKRDDQNSPGGGCGSCSTFIPGSSCGSSHGSGPSCGSSCGGGGGCGGGGCGGG